MTLSEAREIGASKLKIAKPVFDKALEVTRGLDGMNAVDLPPMTLAMAVMGVAKAHQSDQGLQAELTDALELVAKAENEWRLERGMRSVDMGRMQ